MEKFSVLMSVYINDKAELLEQALISVLINQTIKPSEVVLVEDGPLTDDVMNVIQAFKKKFPNIMKVVSLEKNQGLGNALNIGLEHCTFELVARMDSDDISCEDRFETQINYFKEHNEVDAVGGSIAEFYNCIEEVIAKRVVPKSQREIIKMMKRRNPMNHVTVMFKKSSVVNAGGYKHLLYLEDYYLWIRMIEKNFKLANIDNTLVYVRTGEEMYKRRGNYKYIHGWYELQKKMKQMGIINYTNVLINMCSIIGFIYIPPKIKEYIYIKLLRQ